MKVAFDTSVLVASSVVGHAHGGRARPWLEAARTGRIEGLVCCHGLAELWATLTALPVMPRVSAASAERIVRRLRDTMTAITIDAGGYERAIARCVDRGLASGAIYDALHLVAAEEAGATTLLTFNTGHFTRLAIGEGPTILAPPDPPGLIGFEG